MPGKEALLLELVQEVSLQDGSLLLGLDDSLATVSVGPLTVVSHDSSEHMDLNDTGMHSVKIAKVEMVAL